MSFILNEEQKLLKKSAEAFFKQQCPIDTVRQLRDNKDSLAYKLGYKPEVWKQIVEMGWPATIIPEEYGGVGFGFKGLGIILEASGRTLAASPLFSSVALGASALLLAGSDEQKKQWLPLIASGELIFTLALQEGPVHNPRHIFCAAKKTSTAYELTGNKVFVSDGHIANQLVVVARTSGEATDKNGISLFLVDAKKSGISVERNILVDGRNMASISFNQVQLKAGCLLGVEGESYQVLQKIIDRANAALCAEMLGSIQAAFDMTLEYIKQREQFGQPIGSFQALQHRAAQMYCEIELALTLVMRALSAIDEDAMDISLVVSAAKVHLCDTYRLVSNEGIQMHGGMGMTDEMDIGLFLKRARVVMQMFGDENYHLQRYAALRAY